MEDLQQKATSNGLSEDALLPQSSKKDKQILNYLKQQKTGETESDNTTMRSSFYSQKSQEDDEPMPVVQDLESTNKSHTTVSKLNIKNILELSQQEIKIVTEIKKFMQEQEQEL